METLYFECRLRIRRQSLSGGRNLVVQSGGGSHSSHDDRAAQSGFDQAIGAPAKGTQLDLMNLNDLNSVELMSHRPSCDWLRLDPAIGGLVDGNGLGGGGVGVDSLGSEDANGDCHAAAAAAGDDDGVGFHCCCCCCCCCYCCCYHCWWRCCYCSEGDHADSNRSSILHQG